MPRFIGHIRTEAQRLVALIADIIRLSQLDEGVEMPKENVELLSLARRGRRGPADPAADKTLAYASASTVRPPSCSACAGCYTRCFTTSATTPSSITVPTEACSVHVESLRAETPSSRSSTPASASRPSTRAGSSSVSTASTRATPKPPAAPGLGLSIVKHAAHVPRRQGRAGKPGRQRHGNPRHASAPPLSFLFEMRILRTVKSRSAGFFCILHRFYIFPLFRFTIPCYDTDCKRETKLKKKKEQKEE